MLQKGHCDPVPRTELYPENCEEPKRLSEAADAKKPAGVFRDIVSDPTFGSSTNPDTCERDVAEVPQVYTTSCPDGGKPVPKFGQCGGADYNGPTCCFGYSVCVMVRAALALRPPLHACLLLPVRGCWCICMLLAPAAREPG